MEVPAAAGVLVRSVRLQLQRPGDGEEPQLGPGVAGPAPPSHLHASSEDQFRQKSPQCPALGDNWPRESQPVKYNFLQLLLLNSKTSLKLPFESVQVLGTADTSHTLPLVAWL